MYFLKNNNVITMRNFDLNTHPIYIFCFFIMVRFFNSNTAIKNGITYLFKFIYFLIE